MVTKEKIKEEVDKLPEGMLDQVYFWLKRFTSKSRKANLPLQFVILRADGISRISVRMPMNKLFLECAHLC
jgi:hypothetical protein